MKYTLYLCDNMMFNKRQDQLTNAKILFDYSKVAFSTSCCSIDVTVQSAQARFTFEKCCQTRGLKIASHSAVMMMVWADWFHGYFKRVRSFLERFAPIESERYLCLSELQETKQTQLERQHFSCDPLQSTYFTVQKPHLFHRLAHT